MAVITQPGRLCIRRRACVPLAHSTETVVLPRNDLAHADRFNPAGESGALSATNFSSFSHASSLNEVSRAMRLRSATSSAADS